MPLKQPFTSKRSVVDLGHLSYDEALKSQLQWHAKRVEDRVQDTLILVEHDPVMTVGRSGGWEFLKASEEVLKEKGIGLREADRGGKITYHGPGQLVGYPIVKLAESQWSVTQFVGLLQSMIMAVLTEFDIPTESREDQIGVWTLKNRKIASIGIRVAKGVTRHGFALNITNDLSPFSLMEPCGLRDCQMSSVREEGINTDVWTVKKKIIDYWHTRFGSERNYSEMNYALPSKDQSVIN